MENNMKWCDELGLHIPRETKFCDGRVYLPRDGWTEELKPRTICQNCGAEKVWPAVNKIQYCSCGYMPKEITFLADAVKIRRRLEDALRKDRSNKVLEIAKTLNVPLGN